MLYYIENHRIVGTTHTHTHTALGTTPHKVEVDLRIISYSVKYSKLKFSSHLTGMLIVCEFMELSAL